MIFLTPKLGIVEPIPYDTYQGQFGSLFNNPIKYFSMHFYKNN